MSQMAALALTLLVEAPIVLAFVWRLEKDRVRAVLIALAASLLSHPIAWWANGVLRPLPFYTVRAPLIEAGVVVFEAVLYRFTLVPAARRALLVAFVANAASFAVGLAVDFAMRRLGI